MNNIKAFIYKDMKRNATFKVLLMFIVGLFLSVNTFAQQIVVKGIVKDTTGEPIIGANVIVKGTTNGTITDFDGNFLLNANKGDIIIISFIGYRSQEAQAAASMNIILKDDTELLDEVVVIGYGSVKKDDLSGSVVAIKAEEMNKGAVTSPQELIMGKVPGLSVSQGDGAPGAGSTIRIRGGASLNASNDPLIVIDGIPVSNDAAPGTPNALATINPNDIETFTVLKNGENPDTKKEIIYPIIFDGDKTQSWGMAAIIIGARGAEDKDVLLAHSGVDQGWAGFRATSNLVHLFDFQNDEEPKASEIQDKRGIFYDKGRSIDITSSVSGTFETEGWSVFKFSNLDSNGQPGKNTLWVDTDFPMFRLGDIYLMYAEAVARGGEGSKASAVEYINALRKRAYGDEKHNISENWLEENNFRNLLDERGRELYWEGIRRTDLVRFDLLTSGSYTWDFKGGINTGVGVNKRYNVYPIPVTDLTVNGNLQQNEGY